MPNEQKNSEAILKSIDAEVTRAFAKANNIELSETAVHALVQGIREHCDLGTDGDMLEYLRQADPKFLNN